MGGGDPRSVTYFLGGGGSKIRDSLWQGEGGVKNHQK